jgi:hypothetical protein
MRSIAVRGGRVRCTGMRSGWPPITTVRRPFGAMWPRGSYSCGSGSGSYASAASYASISGSRSITIVRDVGSYS